MRISVIRTLAACVLLGFVSGVASHGLIQDPPSRNWYCGAVTKPDQVANGTTKFPVRGNAFSSPGVDCLVTYNDVNSTAKTHR
jgi:chitin-binding protein